MSHWHPALLVSWNSLLKDKFDKKTKKEDEGRGTDDSAWGWLWGWREVVIIRGSTVTPRILLGTIGRMEFPSTEMRETSGRVGLWEKMKTSFYTQV
jgi:hypothetical protein